MKNEIAIGLFYGFILCFLFLLCFFWINKDKIDNVYKPQKITVDGVECVVVGGSNAVSCNWN